MTEPKICAKCKFPNEFSKGDKYWCKKCRLEYNRKYQLKSKFKKRVIETYMLKINGKSGKRHCTYMIGEKSCGREFKSKNNANRYCPRCREIIRKLAENNNNRPYKESVPSRHWEENSMYYDIKHL